MLKPEHKDEEVDFRNDVNKHTTTLTKYCTVCTGVTKVLVNTSNYIDWQSGVYAQNVWPNLTADQREMLISGTHSDCWEYLFPIPEDEEE